MPIGRRVEEWRVVGHGLSWHVLAVVSRRGSRRGVGTTHADWVGAYVDIRRLTADPEGYLRLWIEEMDVQSMRRAWIRDATITAQTRLKITRGNPYDAQHAVYLPECDLFLTGDLPFIQVLQMVRAEAPFPMPSVQHVGGTPGMTLAARREVLEDRA
jgi:hypothetical protein